MSDKSQQTEKATARRIQKARDEGDFASSHHFLGAVTFSLATGLVTSYFGNWFLSTAEFLRALLRWTPPREMSPSQLIFLVHETLTRMLFPLTAAGAGVVVIVCLSQLVVTGFGWSAAKLTPDIAKLNPVAKIKNMASSNFSSFLQAAFLAPIFFYLIYRVSADNVNVFLALIRMDIFSAAMAVGSMMKSLIWKAAGAFLVFGFIDLFRNKRQYQNRLKMSKQEVKQEHKDTEGSAETKARIRRVMRTLGGRRMLRDVKTATAIIVNPTHYSVALSYDPEVGGAPRVVAKGKNYLALRIRTVAIENGITIVENPPLARSLYAAVEVGDEIPANLYRAVAEVLAHVFKLLNTYGMRGRP